MYFISAKIKKYDLVKYFSYEKVGLPLAILILSLIFGLINPVFFSFNNVMNVGRQIAFVG